MKFSFMILSSLFALSVSANLQNANYEDRHNKLIEKRIDSECGYMKDLELVNFSVKTIRIDQGITDREYTTILTGKQRMDQNIFDTYEIIVESTYSDMYDHANKDWGVYSVESVKCIMGLY